MSGCASIYTAPDFGSYKFAHSKIAILPFDVTIETDQDGVNTSSEDLLALEKEQGQTFQRVIYTQFLQGQQRGVAIQSSFRTLTRQTRCSAENWKRTRHQKS